MAKRVLITGATGMVGAYVLKYLLADEQVSEVVSISRRPTNLSNSKLVEIIQNDFENFTNLSHELEDIDVCIYCLAVYQAMVSKKDFFKITCEYQKALTDVLQQLSPKASFVLFSADGASPREMVPSTFSKGKGRAERYLQETIFPKKYIFRPGYICPTGDKKPQPFIYRFFQPLLMALFKIIPQIGVSDKNLAKSMVVVGLTDEQESGYFYNRHVRALTAPEKR